jgi:hypothetical protein
MKKPAGGPVCLTQGALLNMPDPLSVLSLWRVGEIVFRKHRPSLAKLEAVLSSLILSAYGLLPANC